MTLYLVKLRWPVLFDIRQSYTFETTVHLVWIVTFVGSKIVRWMRRNALCLRVILPAICLVLLSVSLFHPAWLSMPLLLLQPGSFQSWLSPSVVRGELKMLSSPSVAVPSLNLLLCQIPQITDCAGGQNKLAIIWQALYQPDLGNSQNTEKVVFPACSRNEIFDSTIFFKPEKTHFVVYKISSNENKEHLPLRSCLLSLAVFCLYIVQ